MRFAGRITEWHDEKGYGFVVPNGGGERAFVHISEFRRSARRPMMGDLVAYAAVKDGLGRWQAREVRHAAERAPKRREGRAPLWVIGVAALFGACVAAVSGWLPMWLAGGYVGLSCLSWPMYLIDKHAAKQGAQRIPESSLHLVDLLGGWPGGLIAQRQFHHKTIKQPFQTVFWITVALNLAGVGWLLRTGATENILRIIGN